MPIVMRRRKNFRKQLLTVILVSVLAGIIGGSLIGITTGHPTPTQATPGSTS